MFIAFALLCLLIFLFVQAQGKGTPVLLYHQVNPLIDLHPALFEEHVAYIASTYQTFTYSEAYDHVKEHGALPKYSLLITFDDGYYDNYKIVFPLLKKYNVKATFFINTLFIGAEERIGDTPFELSEEANKKALLAYYREGRGVSAQYMTESEIKEMQASGLCDFQAHTHTHAPVFVSDELVGFRSAQHDDSSPIHLYQGEVLDGFPNFKSRGTTTVTGYRLDVQQAKLFTQQWASTWKHMTPKEALKAARMYSKQHQLLLPYTEAEARARVVKEIKTNKEILERITGKPVRFFAWPWGHHTAWGRDIIAQEGIVGFVTCKKGGIGLNPNWNHLKRVELRDPSLKKIKSTLSLTTNGLLARIYAWLS
jgi:peptidoglycan/xylan/chitin deacetylase (PgdA/CDA1 family)